MFAPAVKLASDAQIAAKARALPHMRAALGNARGLAAIAAAPSVWYTITGAVIEHRQGVSGDATAEGALDRLLARADTNRANGIDAATLADEFNDSAAEIEDWITGAEATLAGPESAGILAEIAASAAGSLVIDTGLTVDKIVGIDPPPSTSGRDDADIAAAGKRAARIKLGLGLGLGLAAIGLGIGLYLYLS